MLWKAFTYRKLIVEVAEAEDADEETLVGAERVHANLLAHLQKLVTKHRIPRDFLLVLDCEAFQTGLELLQLGGHLLELLRLDLVAQGRFLGRHRLAGLDACNASPAHLY